MTIHTFDTPEAAAMDGFAAAHCRVVASLAQGDDAYVLLDTGPAGHPYLYGVSLARHGGGWRDGVSGNGAGWTIADGESGLGTLAAWDEAPQGADEVRLAFGGAVREVPVANGVYLAAWWRVPCPTGDFPRAEAFRIDGTWVPWPSR